MKNRSPFPAFLPPKRIAALILFGAILSGPLSPGVSASARGEGAVPVLELYRPAGRPGLGLAAWKRFGSTRIPFPGAPILVKLPGGRTWFTQTDFTGMAWVPAGEVLAGMDGKEGPAKVAAALTLEGKLVEKTLSVTRKELLQFSSSAAQAEVDRGNGLARAGKYRDAIPFYQRALALDPECQRASYNIALAWEKLGMKRLAVAAYAQYLVRSQAGAADREEVKRRVIALARGMDPPPPVPARLQGVMDKGMKAALSGDLFAALGNYEAAQAVAPWWAEPYYASGMVYSYLSVQNSFSYAEAAVRCLGNFLAAAPQGDPRLEDVKKRIADLKAVREGLNAPKTISSK